MDVIAEKYRDRVTPAHQMAMEAIGLFRVMLGQHRPTFEALVKAERDMHDFGGMIDPTLYRDMLYSKSIKQQLRLVKAAIMFLDEIEAVATEVELEK